MFVGVGKFMDGGADFESPKNINFIKSGKMLVDVGKFMDGDAEFESPKISILFVSLRKYLWA